jgi:hypothetical protein
VRQLPARRRPGPQLWPRRRWRSGSGPYPAADSPAADSPAVAGPAFDSPSLAGPVVAQPVVACSSVASPSVASPSMASPSVDSTPLAQRVLACRGSYYGKKRLSQQPFVSVLSHRGDAARRRRDPAPSPCPRAQPLPWNRILARLHTCAYINSAARGSAARGSAARGSAARGSAARGSAARRSAARRSAARGWLNRD